MNRAAETLRQSAIRDRGVPGLPAVGIAPRLWSTGRCPGQQALYGGTEASHPVAV